MTAAALEIELVLASTPRAGTLRFNTVYELTHPPLGVEYEVNDADCRVVILAVWDTALGRPRRPAPEGVACAPARGYDGW